MVYACPECGSDSLEVTGYIKVNPNRPVLDVADLEIDEDDGPISCDDCGAYGGTDEFLVSS